MRPAPAPAVPQATPATARKKSPRPEDRPETPEEDTVVLRSQVVMRTRMRAAPPGAAGPRSRRGGVLGAPPKGGAGGEQSSVAQLVTLADQAVNGPVATGRSRRNMSEMSSSRRRSFTNWETR